MREAQGPAGRAACAVGEQGRACWACVLGGQCVLCVLLLLLLLRLLMRPLLPLQLLPLLLMLLWLLTSFCTRRCCRAVSAGGARATAAGASCSTAKTC